jgi:CDP-diacylglycerol--glycerol-3-phosphate 3-phosphatidyltransferase
MDNTVCTLISCFIFIIASLTDTLDGYLARKRNEITDFGKFLDPIADKILVISAYVCFVQTDTILAWGVIVILFREFVVSGLRMSAASKNVVIAADNSGKIKTVLQMVSIVMLILGLCGFNQFLIWNILSYTLYYLSILVALYSGISYLLKHKHILFN